MEMFMMAAVMSLLGVAVCAALFAAATRAEREAQAQPAAHVAPEPQRFFASEAGAQGQAGEARPQTGSVPIEALLLRIEEHIRLEQAAAESFLHAPTGQALRSRTTSRLVN